MYGLQVNLEDISEVTEESPAEEDLSNEAYDIRHTRALKAKNKFWSSRESAAEGEPTIEVGTNFRSLYPKEAEVRIFLRQYFRPLLWVYLFLFLLSFFLHSIVDYNLFLTYFTFAILLFFSFFPFVISSHYSLSSSPAVSCENGFISPPSNSPSLLSLASSRSHPPHSWKGPRWTKSKHERCEG